MYDSGIRKAINAPIWLSTFLQIILLPLSIAQSMIEADSLPTIELLENDRISIYAKRNSDLKYAERFAETVYNAAYETTSEPSGKGLIIIGENDQPHPLTLFEKYREIRGEGEEALMKENDFSFFSFALSGEDWEESDDSLKEEMGDDWNLVTNAIPFPLPPALLHIYLIAKEEEFDDQRIQERFQNLSPQEVRYGEFESFDWVVFLPQKSAVDKAIKKMLPVVMKKEKLGFFKRALVRGAVFTFKPLIRDAVEGFRKSLLYDGILRATSELNGGDINALTNAYRNALMPKGKMLPGKKEDRSFEAIRRQLEKNAEYAKDPFVPPESFIEIDPSLYSRYEGELLGTRDQTIRIYEEDSILYYKDGDSKAAILKPVTETLFGIGGKKSTIEFLPDHEGHYTSAKLKWGRNRRVIHRKEPSSATEERV